MDKDSPIVMMVDEWTVSIWQELIERSLPAITRMVRATRKLGLKVVIAMGYNGEGEPITLDAVTTDKLAPGYLKEQAEQEQEGVWIVFPPCQFPDHRQRYWYLAPEFVAQLFTFEDDAIDKAVMGVVEKVAARFVGEEGPPPDEQDHEPEVAENGTKRHFYDPAQVQRWKQ